MSLRTFQRAVVELTLAPEKARALRAGGGDALADSDLTARERERLLDIVRQPGISVHCSLARGNRFEAVAEVFPMTCVLLEPVLRELLDQLWRERLPDNYQLTGEESAFAALLRRKIAAGELSIEYLDEIFAYELACRELTRRMRMEPSPDAEIEAEVQFQHSPDELLPPLSRLAAPPAGLPRGWYPARVRLRGDRFEVELHSTG
jgi:hypothetical protein